MILKHLLQKINLQNQIVNLEDFYLPKIKYKKEKYASKNENLYPLWMYS